MKITAGMKILTGILLNITEFFANFATKSLNTVFSNQEKDYYED